MAVYSITRLAQNDLQNIRDYSVEEWSITQAEKYLDGLLAYHRDHQGLTFQHGYRKPIVGTVGRQKRIGSPKVFYFACKGVIIS